MRRVPCGDVCPAPAAPLPPRQDNKELLRQQLLSAKARHSAEPRSKPTRSRQKNRWKLKFHHQALPQEYLDHYEQSLQKAERLRVKAEPPSPPPAPPHHAPPPPDMSAPRVLYDDLPYMGEMTLNDSKPRRGRKPKKADICHLIYENYGTVVGGRPPPSPPSPASPAAASPRAQVQRRLVSSLLERKLSSTAPPPPPPPADEPLNLCTRDSPPPPPPNAISVIQRAAISPPTQWPPPPSPATLLYYQRLAAEAPPPSPSPPDAPSKLVLKQMSELLSPSALKRSESPRAAAPLAAAPPAKRKRSAIFIPPVPSSPAAEVSICKFKFTGGSKPSLQEKKMLSVDAGGNFRYYSGTGNKPTNKGFEYMQREAPARRQPDPPAAEDPRAKKRKSRKSLQREKLEQTFKEKGFLIQTQQLQSAEGATYCKFRQLRKFTRYLFRSWRDYLPPDAQGEGGAAPADA